MFFGNERINRKSLFGRKESKRENNIILWLRERVKQGAKKNFQGCAQIYRQEERVLGVFVGFSRIFGIFYNFFGIFLQFFGKFLQFFWNFLQFFLKIFPKIFAIFFDFCIFLTIFPKILAHNPLRFNRGLAIIVSLQLSLQLGLHLYL